MKNLMGAPSGNTNEMQGLANKCTEGDMTQLVNSMNDLFVSVSADLPIVQQPEGITLQKYPQTRLLMILVEKVLKIQNLHDAQLASLSVLSYSRWRPRWRLCIKTCVFSQVYVRLYIVIHVVGCFRSQLIHLEMFQSNQSPFSASKVRH